MSLTNPNTVVTEERLNDFYKGILPYLGGMPEMLANKFSKGDIFSTEEKMIGQWINGKPVYQRTWVVTTQIILTYNTWVTTPIPNPNIQTLINGTFRDLYTDGSYVECSNVHNHVSFAVNSPYIRVLSTREVQSGAVGAYTITLKYTKLTDSAISIGDANDYSTEEKIVGTWVNGEVLYQKTVELGTLPNNTSKTYALGIDSTSSVIGFKAFATNNAGYIVNLPHVDDGNKNSDILFDIEGTSARIIARTNRSTLSGYVTIQYTKTT